MQTPQATNVPDAPANDALDNVDDSSRGEDIFALIGKAENIESASKALQAMAHPMRLKILCILSSGEVPVLDLVDALGTTQSNISQHLAVLREQNIVVTRKDGVQVFYRIEDPRVVQMIEMTRSVFCPI
jgi:DNA-binding transcriptional ArsR family regulator